MDPRDGMTVWPGRRPVARGLPRRIASATTRRCGRFVLADHGHQARMTADPRADAEVSVASGNTQVLTGTFAIGGNASASFCDCKIAEVFTTSDGSQTTALATAIANMKSYIGA